MDWQNQLAKYEGSPIKVWIEDQSGEELAQPKPFALYKVAKTANQQYLQFYLTPTQFFSVPLFDGDFTKMEKTAEGDSFVSHDVEAKLLYRVYFEIGE